MDKIATLSGGALIVITVAVIGQSLFNRSAQDQCLLNRGTHKLVYMDTFWGDAYSCMKRSEI